MYLFLAARGLHCCARLSLVVVSRSYSLVKVQGLLIAVASLVAGFSGCGTQAQQLWLTSSEHGFSSCGGAWAELPCGM